MELTRRDLASAPIACSGCPGVATLLLAVVAIVTAAQWALLTVAIVVIALWAGTTMRHAFTPPRRLAVQ
jgi:hypothetical protein